MKPKPIITMHPDSSKQDWKWLDEQLKRRFPEPIENMPEVSLSFTRKTIAEALSETHSEFAASYKGDVLQHVSMTQLYACTPTCNPPPTEEDP